ncbi:MAG: error-prone DNA polymerase, partial [Alphaproteobacteria bacterium]|nr:error-prone DNA polymerase [Alphaproteobacteria bacterium]
ARLVFSDGTPDILAYPRDRAAWGRLCRLLTTGNRRAEKGDCILRLDDLIEHAEGLQLILLPPRPDIGLAAPTLKRLAHTHLWLGAAMRYRGDDLRHLKRLEALAREHRIPMIATNDVLYHTPARRQLQDVLTCIREHTTLERAGFHLEANAERHLKDPPEMARLFRHHPDAITETMRFLEGCTFSLEELRYEYPEETCEGFASPQEALAAFTEEGAVKRYPQGIPAKVRHALDHELKLIAELNYAPYFLTVHDIVRFARSKGILCQGRGSAANSAVCYCLHVTEVDPNQIDLLFERFVSAERREPPDIDVDFEHERREEVIQYIYNRYGRHRAGLAATVICYRGRSAVRDVGKVFGLSEDTISALSGTLSGWTSAAPVDDQVRALGLDPTDRRLALALKLADELGDFPRHLSQHVGGFVMTRGRLDELIPVSNAAMENRTVVEWDKDDLNALGILKVDVLALGMLSCMRKALAMLHDHYGFTPTLAAIPREEPAVYDMLCRADSLGVFQVESRAQMTMLPRLRPRQFYDLVIEVAIVRPGPIQGGMVHPYLRRRQGNEPIVYPRAELETVLGKTLGVPLFQEQAMRIAIVAAGFTAAEADRLRRSMAAFRRSGTISRFEDKFVEGMIARGYDPDFAARCFRQIEGFGEYGFPESHAASFALLVYYSSWVKCHYPDVFAAALLNSQPMGFYAPAQIVRDAREHGVEVRPVDINASHWDNTLEPSTQNPSWPGPSRPPRAHTPQDPQPLPTLHPRHASMAHEIRTTRALRLGLRQVSGFHEADARRIEAARTQPFDSIRDLWLRTGLEPAALERLADADAFRSLGLDRREALWVVRGLRRAGDKDDLPLLAAASAREHEQDFALPVMPLGQHIVEDYRHLHLSLKAHPVSFLRERLDRRRVITNDALSTTRAGRTVEVAGLVLVRQRPGTASGVIFMTLEDETGVANIIVWPRTFERFRPVVLGARLTLVRGELQSESDVIHVVADHIEDLTPMLDELGGDTTPFRPASRADEVTHPLPSAKQDPAATLWKHPRNVRSVLPKGRNFH